MHGFAARITATLLLAAFTVFGPVLLADHQRVVGDAGPYLFQLFCQCLGFIVAEHQRKLFTAIAVGG